MEAFETAARAGAEGVELDVRLCRSGELVVCHDATLARLTGGRDVRVVAEMPAEELARVDVGNGQAVPLLRQVLAWARGEGVSVNVEMKRDVPSRRRVVAEAARLLGELGAGAPPVLVSSFDPWMLAYLGWLVPGVPRGFLFGEEHPYLRSGWPARALGAAAVHPQRTLCRVEQVGRWRGLGKLVNVWTVNDAEEARKLAAWGVDAIITDVPRVVIDVVR
jgi:glycerophosphoryl diester phosphodiesterase